MTRFLYGRELVVATDSETPYVHRLRNRFRRNPGITVDALNLDDDASLELAKYRLDHVTLINVLEHPRDDAAALRRVFGLLQPGGRAIVFVPAGKSLFGTMDEGVGHQRRYERDELVKLLTEAGFTVDHVSWQNRIAKMAWYVNSRLLKRQGLPAAQSKLFDRLVPLLKAFEGDHPRTGLSLIAVGRKPGGLPGEATVPAEAASLGSPAAVPP